MFQLNAVEKQKVIANSDHLRKLKYSRSLPYAFTEHGTIMAATVLSSTRAVEMSVFVVRAFVGLRRSIAGSQELAQKLAQLEKQIVDHDQQLISVVKAIRFLVGTKEVPKKRRIGFGTGDS